MSINQHCNLITFNCKNVVRSVECIRLLCKHSDIIALQVTWLMPHDLPYLGTIDTDFGYTGMSAVDTSADPLRGRPFGGVALLWTRSAFESVSIIKCHSERLVAIQVSVCSRSFLVFSVYMPTNGLDNLPEFTHCLGEMNAIIDNNNIDSVFMLGDFNAHPSELFYSEL